MEPPTRYSPSAQALTLRRCSGCFSGLQISVPSIPFDFGVPLSTMRLLLTADLRYRVSWFKWLEAQASQYDVSQSRRKLIEERHLALCRRDLRLITGISRFCGGSSDQTARSFSKVVSNQFGNRLRSTTAH
jgi:hypothetical protein